MTAVGYAVMTLCLRTIDRTTQHSVAFDPAAKIKLRHLLGQMRETVDGLDVSVAKKEALFKKINALQAEIDRDRTRYQAYAALAIEACDDAEKAAKKLGSVKRPIESVGGVFGDAKRAEDAQPKLPPRREPKQISPPKFVSTKALSSKHNGDRYDKPLDDEIPF
jgi:hypothetical protein